jgi:hypothetical protein
MNYVILSSLTKDVTTPKKLGCLIWRCLNNSSFCETTNIAGMSMINHQVIMNDYANVRIFLELLHKMPRPVSKLLQYFDSTCFQVY